MAALAHGRPVATTHGWLTEPLWFDGGVALVPADAPARLVAVAEALLADIQTRNRLGAEGRRIYEQRFAHGKDSRNSLEFMMTRGPA